MPAGRPEKVTDEVVEQAATWVRGGYESEGDVIPTVEGLAIHLDLSRETLYARPEFSDTLSELKQIQARRILNNGLIGKYNANFAKFVMSASHGMVEKTAQEHSGELGLSVNLVSYADDHGSVQV